MPNLDKIKSISDASQRETFRGDNTIAALQAAMPYIVHLKSLAGKDVEWIVFGAAEDGKIQSAKWPADFHANVMVSTLSKRVVVGTKPDGKPQTKLVVEAVVVHPVPTLDAMLANKAGRDMVEGIMETQTNHKAVAVLREAENMIAVADQMPVSIESFATAGRGEKQSKLLEAFNVYVNEINGYLRKNSQVWLQAKLVKATIRQCLESKARATYFYSAIEEAGLFEAALDGLIQLAQDDGSDTSLFHKWKATRQEVSFTPEVVKDITINADSIVAALTATKSDPEQAGEGEAEATEGDAAPAGEQPEEPSQPTDDEAQDAAEAPAAA